ncbi:MAG TPA: cytochrome P450 [Pseudonocardia sp.]|jgi:cytochrome P450|nr:cytochrome P450 [Pseudonocardia sp.]
MDLRERFAAYSGYHCSPSEGVELFREAREAGCPVVHSDRLGGFHLLLDHADVRRVHGDWQTFSHEPSVMRPLVDRPGFPPLEYDPPRHTQWRELISYLFNGATARRIEEPVRADINRIIDSIAAAGACDLIRVFAEEVPMTVLCHVLGLDGDKRAEVRERTLAVMAAAEDPEKGAAAFMDFAAFGIGEVHRRRAQPASEDGPAEDGMSTIARWRMDGRPMTDLEIGQAMNSVLIAGHGTSISGIGSMFYEVLSRPDLRDKLAADPSLVPLAVEEALRLHPPFFGLYRRVTAPVTVAGTDIAEDESVMVCWAAANRDPKVFEHPDEFRLDRPRSPERHLSFGVGLHACPGQMVVRMEMRLLLTELLRRLPDIELVDPGAVEYVFGGGEMAGIPTLPARFTPKGRPPNPA